MKYEDVLAINTEEAQTAGYWCEQLGINRGTFYNWWRRFSELTGCKSYKRCTSKWAIYRGEDIKRMCTYFS